MPPEQLTAITNLAASKNGKHHPDSAAHAMPAKLPEDENVREKAEDEQLCCVTVDRDEHDVGRATKHDHTRTTGVAAASATTLTLAADSAPAAPPGSTSTSAVEHLTADFAYATVTSMLRQPAELAAPATSAIDAGTASPKIAIVSGNSTSAEDFAVSDDGCSSPTVNGASNPCQENEGTQLAEREDSVHEPYDDDTGKVYEDEYSDDYESEDGDRQSDTKRGRCQEVDWSGYRKQLWASGG